MTKPLTVNNSNTNTEIKIMNTNYEYQYRSGEILEALVQLRVKELMAQNEANAKLRVSLENKIKPRVAKLTKSLFGNARIDIGSQSTEYVGRVNGRSTWKKAPGTWTGMQARVDVDYNDIPDDLRLMLADYEAANVGLSVNETEIRKELRNQLSNHQSNNEERVAALVALPAMTTLLNTLTGTTVTEIAAIEA